jgi:plasmid maintenance system killer protein
MIIVLSNRAAVAIAYASGDLQRSFYKQMKFLAGNLNHPSLRAKKYDEGNDIWQARVNRGWRFYFKIDHDTCLITDVTSHPK